MAPLLLLAAHAAVAASATEEAQTLMSQGQFDQALKRVDSQLKSQPQDAEARFLRGLILVKLNRGPEAIKVFADLTRDYPQLPEPYNNLAVLYAQQGDYEKARDALEAALATHPSYATAHENLGDIYAALAGAAYNRALALDQSNETVRSKLSLINQLDRGSSVAPTKAPPVATTAVVAPPIATPPPISVPPPSTVPPPPPTSTTNSDSGSSPTQAAISVVNAWAAAWSAKDLAGYFATYSPDFKPEGGISRSTWEAQRRDRITRAKHISVSASGEEIERLAPDLVNVNFTQNYSADNYSDKVAKTLELQQAGGSWLIVREYSR